MMNAARVARRVGRNRAVIAVALVMLSSGVSALAQSVTQIRDVGPRSNRINLVILSEGYTAEELTTKFPADARTIMEGFLEAEPYREYRDYVNVFTIAVASAQSGSDHPSRGIARNTYFNSTYDSYGQERLLTIPPNDLNGSYAQGQGKVDALLAQFVPDYDLAVMVVNDPEYGGAGGKTSIVSVNEFATEIAVHETGHTFADLADEYEFAAPQVPKLERPNVTQQTSRGAIKWRSWILASTPIPTPKTLDPNTGWPQYFDQVGLFEGANYSPTGWYRPKFSCKMNSLGAPFCEVCAETLTLNIYRRLSPIDSFTPTTRDLTVGAGQSVVLRVKKLQPTTHDLSVQWFMDGTAVAGATGDSFTISAANASVGSHTVRVDVSDGTPLVRTDPSNNLKRSETWTVNVTSSTAPEPAPVLNISTRLGVATGENVLIGGFIIQGSEAKKVIVRAIGPSLGADVGPVSSTIAEPLADPILDLLDSSGVVVASNDNWQDTQPAEIKSSTVPPRDDLESAIVRTLPPGAYTAKVSGKNQTSGVGLVEVFDLQQSSSTQLVNISTRGLVQSGEGVMIGGFIVGSSGSGQATVIVRALGPSLTNSGIAGALANPTLELRDGNGALVRENDDWKESQQADIEASGVKPANDREAAVVATLPAGAYTAIVRGKSGTAGVGLFELYNLRR